MEFTDVLQIEYVLRQDSYRRHAAEGLSPDMKAAVAFRDILCGMPIGVSGETSFRGELGAEFFSGSERIEWKKTVEEEGRAYAEAVKAASKRPKDFFETMALEHAFSCGKGGEAHTTVDYGLVLQIGLKGIHERSKGEDDFHKAVRISLEAMRDFGLRCGCRVPWEPATSFHEALQSIWLVHVGIALSESSSASLSLGRMDKYLEPFVGTLSDSELLEEIGEFYKLLDHGEFMDGAMALNIGGMPGGFGRLSRLFAEAHAKGNTAAPLLTARITKDMAEEDFNLLCDQRLWRKGQPTFYGEESCRAALSFRGVPEDELSDWAVNSCMGLMLPGREWQDMWGVVMLMPLFLEICANGGRPYKGELHEDSPRGPVHEYHDYQQLEDDVIEWFALFAERYVKENERRGMARLADRRNPFVSALLHDCIERGRDVQDGGVRFRIMVFEPFGLADLANGLYAIREMVFRRRRFTLEELNSIVRDNYAGHEDVRLELSMLPKYGQNDSEINSLMARISERVADIIIALSPKGIICAPSFHTLANNVSCGGKAMAGFDGRLAGTPLSKNAGTRPDITREPTSMLLSAAAVDQRKFFGGQPVDLWLNGDHWFTPEGRKRFRAMLETYFALGGLQVQVNGVSRSELEAAMAHPDEHRDLIVRIGGFSRHFVDLSSNVQREFIARCES